MIEVRQLVAAGVGPTQARVFAPLLTEFCWAYKIDTRLRIAAFLAQGMHESTNFTRLEENLYYTTPERLMAVFSSFRSIADAMPYVRNPKALANRVYGNRYGNKGPDDGWRYRGRGIFGITFYDNYKVEGDAVQKDYITHPELVAEPSDAVLTACSRWARTGCNTPADQGLIDQITRRINGAAMEGRAQRASNYQRLLTVL